MVTRAREQASDFLTELTRLGAECVELPTIEVVPPKSWEALDQAIEAFADSIVEYFSKEKQRSLKS